MLTTDATLPCYVSLMAGAILREYTEYVLPQTFHNRHFATHLPPATVRFYVSAMPAAVFRDACEWLCPIVEFQRESGLSAAFLERCCELKLSFSDTRLPELDLVLSELRPEHVTPALLFQTIQRSQIDIAGFQWFLSIMNLNRYSLVTADVDLLKSTRLALP
jgi:hypothetical protein